MIVNVKNIIIMILLIKSVNGKNNNFYIYI